MVRAFAPVLDVIILAITTSISWLMPSLTRRDLLFGVTVAPNARALPAGRSIIGRYRIQVLGVALWFAVVLALLAIFTPDVWWLSGWLSLVVLAPVLLMSVPYLLAYRASRALHVAPQEGSAVAEPASSPEAELRPRRYADYIPLIWEALPLAIIAATATYLANSYAAAPAIIPVHFDIAGNPNAYAQKTIGSYLLLVWVQLGLEVLLTGMTLLIVGSKALPGRAENRFRRWWLRYLFGMKVLTLAFLGVLAVLVAETAQSGSAAPIARVLPFTLAYVFVLLVSAVVLAIRTGQGGSRLGSPAETAVDRIDDRYWKLGAIYVNPEDPSLFVEKRFGVGWTINFGNRWGVIAICMLLAVVILLPLVRSIVGMR
jgi:uncharacterized membrane protein